jgi:hypothetical protein
MKIPNELILEWLMLMSHEELLRFRKRLDMKIGQKLRKDAREHLMDLLTAEIKRRDANHQTE